MPFPVTIYHNPACSTSRKVLGLIREAGIEPTVVLYLKTPPTRDALQALITRAQVPARTFLREKESLAAELGLLGDGVDDKALLDAMATHPVLINRPLVFSPKGVKLCRPAESVSNLLP